MYNTSTYDNKPYNISGNINAAGLQVRFTPKIIGGQQIAPGATVDSLGTSILLLNTVQDLNFESKQEIGAIHAIGGVHTIDYSQGVITGTGSMTLLQGDLKRLRLLNGGNAITGLEGSLSLLGKESNTNTGGLSYSNGILHDVIFSNDGYNVALNDSVKCTINFLFTKFVPI